MDMYDRSNNDPVSYEDPPGESVNILMPAGLEAHLIRWE